MIDAKMKRTMKWHTEGHIDTNVVYEVAMKKAIKNMDQDSLKRLLNEHYGMPAMETDAIAILLIWDELQRRNKEENKMEDKKYYSGSVAVATWRLRETFNGDNVTSNRKSDLITFREGVFVGMVVDSNRKIADALSVDTKKKYTKEDIVEFIKTAWDKGEYADDQTEISWIFNPDHEGFTGTVDLATVLLKDPKGDGQHLEPRVTARCRVRIVNGEFFEKLDGSSKLADILKNHKGAFETKEHIETYIKNKWYVGDFGNNASYFTLDIEEES